MHSTNTALTTISHHLHTQYHSNIFPALMQTDLSAAFDTVDNTLLLNKLEHYGFRGESLELLTSFLNNSQQYVWIDGKESDLKNLLIVW